MQNFYEIWSKCKVFPYSAGMAAYTFNSSTQEAESTFQGLKALIPKSYISFTESVCFE